ncbi:MAG: sigma-E processing peptidase SpoIIGA [Clostridia bacterium]
MTIIFKINKTIAIMDTGNMLKDPISRMPVIVVEKDVLYDMIPYRILQNIEYIIGGDVPKELYEEGNVEYLSKFRVIPFSSIGKQNGLLLGFKAKKVEVEILEEEETIENVIIGIYDKTLSKKNQYHALLGLDILERSEENEFITNVSQ